MNPFITDVTAYSSVSLSNISVTFCTGIFRHRGGGEGSLHSQKGVAYWRIEFGLGGGGRGEKTRKVRFGRGGGGD